MQDNVTQADREAAATAYCKQRGAIEAEHSQILSGLRDDHVLVGLFARHRLASTTAQSEAVQTLLEAWSKRTGSTEVTGEAVPYLKVYFDSKDEVRDLNDAIRALVGTRPAPKADGLVEQIAKGIEWQIERGAATILVGRNKAQVILAALKDRDVVLEEAAKGIRMIHNALADPSRPRQACGEVAAYWLDRIDTALKERV